MCSGCVVIFVDIHIHNRPTPLRRSVPQPSSSCITLAGHREEAGHSFHPSRTQWSVGDEHFHRQAPYKTTRGKLDLNSPSTYILLKPHPEYAMVCCRIHGFFLVFLMASIRRFSEWQSWATWVFAPSWILQCSATCDLWLWVGDMWWYVIPYVSNYKTKGSHNGKLESFVDLRFACIPPGMAESTLRRFCKEVPEVLVVWCCRMVALHGCCFLLPCERMLV